MMIERILSNVEQLEKLAESEKNRLTAMPARSRILGNKEIIIERDIECMDNARFSMQEAINELSKIFEALS